MYYIYSLVERSKINKNMSKTKHVKLFEQLDNEDEFENRPLTAGEKRAISAGLDLLTTPQMAAMYLAAKARVERGQDRSNVSDFRASQLADSEAEDFRTVGPYRLADLLGLKPLTVSRTVNKFRLLLLGEERESEVFYEKLINKFTEFEAMPAFDVLQLAEDAINYEADTSVSDAYREKVAGQAAKSKDNIEARDKRIGFKFKSLYNSLRTKFPDAKAMKMAIQTITAEEQLPREKIVIIAKQYSKGTPSLVRLIK